MIKKIWLSLTQKCNWNCWYCDHPSIKHPKTVTHEQLDRIIPILKNNLNDRKDVDISLEGGEIGLIDVDILDRIFESGIAKKYFISTNGTFLERYYDRYKDKLCDILYHIFPDFSNDNTFIEYYFNDNINIRYTFVLDKNNIQYLSDFLDDHPDKMFCPHYLKPRSHDFKFLEQEDYCNIYNIIKDRNNIDEDFKRRGRLLCEGIDETHLNNLRFLCANIYTKPIIDLFNEKIHRCCVAVSTEIVDFNEENFEKLLNNEFIFSPLEEKCGYCIANFLWRHKIEKYDPMLLCKIGKLKNVE